jgi:hypothetical protein
MPDFTVASHFACIGAPFLNTAPSTANLLQPYIDMPKATSDYNLFLLKPHLVKEWHPTKNGSLRPCDVTPGSGKKVWWICEAGHEWKAVIYSRSRGNGCRFCNQNAKIGDNHRSLSIQKFIKEWHPTKNSALNPRDATALRGQKVWWICETGHEWQATLDNRIRGRGCPVCEGDFALDGFHNIGGPVHPTVRTDNEMPQKEPLETYFGTEFRKSRRYRQEAIAIVEVPKSGHIIYAQMQNLSNGGMYFETEISIKPGTRITIKFDKPIFHTASKIYTSSVRWCKGLTDDRGIINTYGFGVKFI